MNKLKVKFENNISAKEYGVIFEREFIKQGNRLFYIVECLDVNDKLLTFNSLFNYTGVELIKDGNFYICNPVIIDTAGNAMDERISTVKEINDIDEKDFYLSQDIMVSFLNDLEGVEYHNENILSLVKPLIKNHSESCYYYASGNENEFSFEILNKFRFTGKIYEGVIFGSIILSDILFTDDNNSEYSIKLPMVGIKGMLDICENDDTKALFSSLLESFTMEDMKDYIIHSIELYLDK